MVAAHLPLHVLQQIGVSLSEVDMVELNRFNQIGSCQRTTIHFGQLPKAIYRTSKASYYSVPLEVTAEQQPHSHRLSCRTKLLKLLCLKYRGSTLRANSW